MKSSLDQILGFHQKALALRAERQQLIASNIANADTPDYKARDIDFRAAMAAVQGGAGAPVRTATGHLSPAGSSAAGSPLLYRSTVQASVDGNTVDMDVERAQFADNALRYEANLTFISGQIKTMLAAIQG
ncbi:MAG: flagellar basal body rod protein FlgB [Burkholderiales bacterium]|nr:flagellar basal body rod protein FlgB [Burkholderiales bacterium]